MENGRHLLSLEVGPIIYIYAQVSRDIAQNNVALMREDQYKRSGKPMLRKNSYMLGSIDTNKLVRFSFVCWILAQKMVT
jgi:hypothetical protein